jgi:hypothetical protein
MIWGGGGFISSAPTFVSTSLSDTSRRFASRYPPRSVPRAQRAEVCPISLGTSNRTYALWLPGICLISLRNRIKFQRSPSYLYHHLPHLLNALISLPTLISRITLISQGGHERSDQFPSCGTPGVPKASAHRPGHFRRGDFHPLPVRWSASWPKSSEWSCAPPCGFLALWPFRAPHAFAVSALSRLPRFLFVPPPTPGFLFRRT